MKIRFLGIQDCNLLKMQKSLFLIRALESSYFSNVSPTVKRKIFAIWIWIFTFIIYASYHMSRKPISVVKTVLSENCSEKIAPYITNDSHWCDWKPFTNENSSTLLGILDSAYLFTYAFGVFFSGMIAERSRLNVYLCIGMVLSGIMTAAFGFGFTFNIHVYWYFIIVQMLCGVVESTGWPGVVTVMGNWFGKSKRGLIMGVWNSHTSVGNIVGTLIATAFLNSNWGLSFIVPGIMIAVMGFFVLLFLIPQPSDVGLENPNYLNGNDKEESQFTADDAEVRQRLLQDMDICDDEVKIICHSPAEGNPISFIGALSIPGVVEFSFSLFFSKLVSYTFLYWLPHFIYDNTSSDADQSGEMSTFFDVGGIVGGIFAGIMNDYSGMPATVCSALLIVAVFVIYIYQVINTTLTMVGNMMMLTLVGLLVNGPYALITTAVSAALGTHSSLKGNAKALSTVSSIIDGTGSFGAACGPLLAGILKKNGNWSSVFSMMMVADVCSMLLLMRLMKREISHLLTKRKNR